jgi:DNA replication initiation complex subunit (GINS family)
MITYNEIYEAARKERYSGQLQPIAKNFVNEVSKYLKEKKEAMSSNEDVFSDVLLKNKKQLENAITLFKELIIRRRKKILNLILVAAETGISKQDFNNMLSFEKALFEDLMKCLESSEKRLNENLSGQEVIDQHNELIVFLEDVAEFVGFDGSSVGPFIKGQIANLSKDVAKILIDASKAEIMGK